MKLIHSNLRQIKRPNCLPNTLNLGLTGGIGSGKSTVATLLKEKGSAVIDLDAISRQITLAGGLAMPAIQQEFGDEMLAPDGSLLRDKMRVLIFNDAKAKSCLERISHVYIFEESIRQAGLAALSNPLCIVYDIPLLVGSQQWLELLDFIVVVDCEPEIQIQRVLARNPELDIDMVQKIIGSQASREQLFEIADVLIDNSTNGKKHEHIYIQVNRLLECVKYIAKIKSMQLKTL